MDIWFYSIVIIIFFASLRLLPHFFSPNGGGVDHWFWKAYIEEYRKNKSFPPILPQFLLDIHQWYPPLFPLFIAKLPEALFEKYSHFLAIIIDLMRLTLLMTAAYLITDRVNSVVAAGVTYSLTPILISNNSQLSPRGLGALFLDATVLILIWLIWHEGAFWGWGLVVLLSGLILLTHKMTTQLFWFSSIVSGVVFLDWRLLILVPASILSALILSRGFYINVLKAHWDIIKFWNKNWPWLSAHQIRESPIYGIPDYITPTKYYRPGISGLTHLFKFVLGFNPCAWTILFSSIWLYGPNSNLTTEDLWMIQWLGFVLLFLVLTTFLPFMRCLGNGYLYNYNAAFPTSLLVAMIWGGLKHTQIVTIILAITALICLASIIIYFRTLKNSKTQKVDDSMVQVLNHLKKLPNGVVWCFPAHWHDLVAYKTNKKVLSGAHGFGFKILQPLWPRLLIPISDVITKYQVQYILTIDGYLSEKFIKELPDNSVTSIGPYRLHEMS